MQVWCPFCGQGWVRYYRVAERAEPFWTCEECEAVGLGDSIEPSADGTLEVFFEEWGHTTHWVGMAEVER